MRLQLVDPTLGPEDAKIVPALADYGLDTLVPALAVIDVPPALAGKGPHWRAPAAGDDLNFMDNKMDDNGQIATVHDLGYGLLAQVGIWAKPTDEKDAAAPTKKD